MQISTNKTVGFPYLTAAFTNLLNLRASVAATSSKEDGATKKGAVEYLDIAFFLILYFPKLIRTRRKSFLRDYSRRPQAE